jgi:hypothetical protein
MDAQYYVTTLTNAFTKLGPLFLFLIGGYFVFIKLPFLFLKKSMNDQKRKLEETEAPVAIKIEAAKKPETLRIPSAKKEGPKKEEPKKEEIKKKAPPTPDKTPEEILGFKKGAIIPKGELKSRYFELLKQNHPDRVASMGEDFQKLADKNTKDINKAYDLLKKKAS